MKITSLLDVIGAVSLVLFAFALWPPLSLLVFGAACLLASWRRS